MVRFSNTSTYHISINNLLSFCDSKIRINTTCQKYDFDKDCEDILLPVLNMVYDLNLVNLNHNYSNFPAVDLGDEKQRICFQITSTDTVKKYKDTVKKFKEHQLDKKFDKLIFLILGEKRRKSKFDDYEVIDLYVLANEINKITDKCKLENILTHLENEISEDDFKGKYSTSNQFELTQINNSRGANSFLSYLYEDSEDGKSDLDEFMSELQNISRSTRKMILTVCTRTRLKNYKRNGWSSNYIFFNINKIFNLSTNKSEFQSQVSDLSSMNKLFNCEDDEFPDAIYYFSFTCSFGECILYHICNYLEEKGKLEKLESILIDLATSPLA